MSPAVHAEREALSSARARLTGDQAAWATEKGQQEEALQGKEVDVSKALDSVEAQRKVLEGKWATMAKEEKKLAAGKSTTLHLQSVQRPKHSMPACEFIMLLLTQLTQHLGNVI